jgi:hypothetical protein
MMKKFTSINEENAEGPVVDVKVMQISDGRMVGDFYA